jgi:hypothetical protein
MKVKFKRNISSISGKVEDEVYYYNRALHETIMRSYTKPERNPMAERYKLIMANLKLINPSEGFKRDIRDYLVLYNRLKVTECKPVISWMNIYLKMLFAMEKGYPGIDLATLTREQIEQENLPCKNVKAAIESGLLPLVRGYEWLTNDI